MGILRRIILATTIVYAMTISAVQPYVYDIGIFGNNSVSSKELIAIMQTERRAAHPLMPSIFEPIFYGPLDRFNRNILEKDLTTIKELYRQKGFLDVDISANIVKSSDVESHDLDERKDDIYINIFIDEGNRYKVEAIDLTGDTLMATDLITNYPDSLNMMQGEFFSPALVSVDGRIIQTHIQEAGYPYAKVEFKWSKFDSYKVAITHNIKQDKPAYFGNTEYKNLRTAKKFILEREMDFKYGDRYSRTAVIESIENLYRTGLFQVVRVEADSFNLQPDTLDYSVTVFEKEPHFYGFKVGVSTNPSYDFTTDITPHWGTRNLWGNGYSLETRATSSLELIKKWDDISHRIDVDFISPRSFELRMPVRLNLFFEYFDIEDDQFIYGYEWGGVLSGQYLQNDDMRHLLSVTNKWRIVKNSVYSEGDTTYKFTHKPSLERAVGYTFEFDSRNSPFFPTRGVYFAVSEQLSGWILGGDEKYNKLESGLSKYENVVGDVIIASRIKGGYIVNFESENIVNQYNSFRLGGANSIRGYRERSLGKYVEDEDGKNRINVGGNIYFLGNFELRAPIPSVKGFYWQYFVDAGNLWAEPRRITAKSLRLSTGAGLSYRTPFGPVRFEWGFQLFNKARDYNNEWHLSILYAF